MFSNLLIQKTSKQIFISSRYDNGDTRLNATLLLNELSILTFMVVVESVRLVLGQKHQIVSFKMLKEYKAKLIMMALYFKQLIIIHHVI